MPAPTQSTIRANIENALIANGVTKKHYDNNGNLIDDGVLTDPMNSIVDGIATGIFNTWNTWQAAQTVTAVVQVNTGTGTGATTPAPGNLP